MESEPQRGPQRWGSLHCDLAELALDAVVGDIDAGLGVIGLEHEPGQVASRHLRLSRSERGRVDQRKEEANL